MSDLVFAPELQRYVVTVGLPVVRAGQVANPEALRLFGAESFDRLAERNLMELVHPGDRERVAMRVRKVMAGGRTPLREVRLLRLDGQDVLAEAIAGPVEYGGERAAQVIIEDISEVRRAEDAQVGC